ncbi:MAG: panthothenate synthetase [Verrucomicrobiia bacterium]
MKMLLDVTIPHEPFNSLVRKGVAGKKLGDILDALKPEAAYFTEQDGKRGAILVVNMPDSTKLPSLAEPWFLTFNADVKLRVFMSPEDLKNSGLDALGKKWA